MITSNLGEGFQMKEFRQSAARFSLRALVAVTCVCMALATVPSMAQGKKESKEATKFRTQGEQARVAIEKVRDQLAKTVETYDALLAAADKKLQASHKKLAEEVTKTEKVVDEGRKQVTTFQETAEKFFVSWEQGVSDIATESIRKASERRFQAAHTGFKNMVENLGAAREAYGPLMGSLKEQVTLLSQDLTPETVAMLREDVAAGLHSQAEQVFASIERSLSQEKVNEDEVNQILAEEEAETGGEVMDGEGAEGEEEMGDQE
jgi:phosphoenolpyruvate-protein kinase (PTS system EI component)